MKKISVQFSLLILLIAIIIQGCLVQDPLEVPELETFFEESFENLDLEVIQSVETPFQSVFQSSASRNKEGITLEAISAKLAEIFPDAEILEVEEEIERGLSVWEIKLKMPGGGILKLSFIQELGLIVKIKGKSGPFDYEVDPGGSFIPFSEAARLAIEASNGEIEKWELELEENNEWEYEIHLTRDGKRYEVEIKGFEAEIISIKLKQENDDNEDFENHEATPPEAIAELALSLFAGEIIHSETKEDDQHKVWKLYIESETGSIVKFKILEDPLQLLEMEGENGPFDYNIEPGVPYMSLMDATELAISVFPGELTKWEFEIIHRDDNLLAIYEFKIVDGDTRVQILIHAETGEILDLETSNHNGHNADIPAEVAEFALNFFPGEIIEGHLYHEDQGNIWKLHIRAESGAVVRFLINNDPLSLLEMKAEQGPFDYNIDPGDAYISLEEARGIALTEIDGELTEWKFGFEGDDGEVFPFYLLRFAGENLEASLFIHAESGVILHIDRQGEPGTLPAEVAALALSIFPGEIAEFHPDHENDHRIWKVYIISEIGSLVGFVIKEDPLTLLMMLGEHGPFEYNIEPDDAVISLNTARLIAESEVPGELIFWTFHIQYGDHTDQVVKLYELLYQSESGEFLVIINAKSEEIIEIISKNEQHDGDHHDLAPETVKLFAQTYFDGEIIHSEKHIEGDLIIWELLLESESGAQVKFYLLETLELLKMKGDNGPFDYNIEPGDPYITLNAAVEISKDVFNGELSKWEYREEHLEDTAIMVYELRLEMENGSVEFLIHAESGEVLRVED